MGWAMAQHMHKNCVKCHHSYCGNSAISFLNLWLDDHYQQPKLVACSCLCGAKLAAHINSPFVDVYHLGATWPTINGPTLS